jgi:hypothetical protein
MLSSPPAAIRRCSIGTATVFGARAQYQDAAATFLTFDDEHHRFLIANLDVIAPSQGGPDREGLVGVAHLAYSLADLQDLADHYLCLKREGIFPFWVIHHGFTISMYYGDPDCNDIERVDDGQMRSSRTNSTRRPRVGNDDLYR